MWRWIAIYKTKNVQFCQKSVNAIIGHGKILLTLKLHARLLVRPLQVFFSAIGTPSTLTRTV